MDKHPVPRSALLERTLHLLRERSRTKTLQIIEQETGLQVPWLKGLLRGKTNSPSVCRIVLLYEYLSGKTLAIE